MNTLLGSIYGLGSLLQRLAGKRGSKKWLRWRLERKIKKIAMNRAEQRTVDALFRLLLLPDDILAQRVVDMEYCHHLTPFDLETIREQFRKLREER